MKRLACWLQTRHAETEVAPIECRLVRCEPHAFRTEWEVNAVVSCRCGLNRHFEGEPLGWETRLSGSSPS